jgi:thioredoxin reductase (NADPH)
MGKNGHQQSKVIGCRWCPRTFAVCSMLSNNLVPYEFIPVDSPQQAAEILNHPGITYEQLPIVLCETLMLMAPDEATLAELLGYSVHPSQDRWDLVTIGAGPAGLSAAVYGASEGLSVMLLEHHHVGGQAGLSARIENYLGFDDGIAGVELANRARHQAQKFGVDIVSPRGVTAIDFGEGYKFAVLDDGSQIACRALLLAMGVSFRRLEAPGVDALIDRGVYYSAPMSEALQHSDERVFIVGGANSAGQAAVALAAICQRVVMLVRGSSLDKEMSKYLVDSINSLPNIDVQLNSEVVEARGSEHLEAIRIRTKGGGERWEEASVLYIYIGAVPRTERLAGKLELDDHGFIRTGFAGPGDLQTSSPGIFAAGDIRSGSTKRVATAVGEGCMAIPQVHAYLGSLGVSKVLQRT